MQIGVNSRIVAVREIVYGQGTVFAGCKGRVIGEKSYSTMDELYHKIHWDCFDYSSIGIGIDYHLINKNNTLDRIEAISEYSMPLLTDTDFDI